MHDLFGRSRIVLFGLHNSLTFQVCSTEILSCQLILFRVGKQRLREARLQAVDYLILLLAGACLGTLAKVDDETFGSTGYTYTVIAVCKLTLTCALP